MTPKTVPSSIDMGLKIRNRRKELDLTIEEAARKAGVGTKTWSRYESGDSIRADKLRGVLRVLNWKEIPEQDHIYDAERELDVDSGHEAWSIYLEKTFGRATAKAFAAASDILLDEVTQDLDELSHEPKGTHLGELAASWILDYLPGQFVTRYDYEFLYAMRQYLKSLRNQAKSDRPLIAHTVIEELIIHLIEEQVAVLVDLGCLSDYEEECPEGLLGEICGDADILTFLYSDSSCIEAGEIYHFDQWLKPQFYLRR